MERLIGPMAYPRPMNDDIMDWGSGGKRIPHHTYVLIEQLRIEHPPLTDEY